MRSDIMQQLRGAYAEQRDKNTAEEYRRREQAEQAIPGFADLLQQRQELVFAGVRGILAGETADELPAQMEAVNQRILTALEDNGFPGTWLDPVYRCPICHDTGYTGEPIREMCGCMRQAYHLEMMRQLGFAQTDEISFSSFDAQLIPDVSIPNSRFTQRSLSLDNKRIAEEWVQEWPQSSPMVLLQGASGLGKTYLMRCMVRALSERGKDVLLLSVYQLMEFARRAIFENSADALDSCMAVDCLFLDDLGSEPMIPNITIEQLYSLINERLNANRATVISTNLKLEQLRERYGERIVSRLTDQRNATVLVFRGDDLRRIKKGGTAT